ncbi:MAG: phosphate acyltransferase PlsX, partial [Clostridia bacterium]|nr:phosphate acyltransferase PlsX [Clostridia bacterium]
MKVVIDAFGGDYAPYEIVLGAVKALQENEKLKVVLVGDKDRIIELLQQIVFLSDRLEIVHAPDVVANEDESIDSLSGKKTSSIVVAYDYLAAHDDAVALVTAGSTGATLAGAQLKLERINGIKRWELAPLFPTVTDGKVMMLDYGVSAETTAENMYQFAVMGNEFMKALGVKKPRIALLNLGIDAGKGDDQHKLAYQMLKNSKLNFVGNIESRDIMRGSVDVVVTDGFSGNICLKSIEGTVEIIFNELKDATSKNVKSKLGALLLRSGFTEIKSRYDYTKLGGAPLLGFDKIILKCHG